MFVSPCSLRSAQCAALIALATAAGLARTGPETSPRSTTDSAARTTQPTAGLTFELSSPRFTSVQLGSSGTFSHPGAVNAPSLWLQPASTLALWFLCGSDSAGDRASTLPACAAAHPAAAHLAAPFAEPGLRIPPTFAPAPAFPRPTHRPALCTLSHLIPFAVGPPAIEAQPNRCAARTSVPSDLASLRSPVVACFRSVRSVSSRVFFVARLACPAFSAPRPADARPRPSFALRGKPAPASSARRLPLQLRASGAPSLAARPPPLARLFP